MDEKVVRLKEAGIEYVILVNRENNPDMENVDEILGDKLGQTGATEIYKLKSNN